MRKLLLLIVLSVCGTVAYAQCDGGFCGNSMSYNSNIVHYNTSTSSNALSKKIEVAIYPNPTADYVRFENNTRIKRFCIFNLNGVMMKDFVVAGDELYSVSDLNEGMYVIQFYGLKNKVLNTQRINILKY